MEVELHSFVTSEPNKGEWLTSRQVTTNGGSAATASLQDEENRSLKSDV